VTREWLFLAWVTYTSIALPVLMAAPIVAWGGAPWGDALAWSLAWASVTGAISFVVVYCTLLLVQAADWLKSRQTKTIAV
jgi:hypothetical protein